MVRPGVPPDTRSWPHLRFNEGFIHRPQCYLSAQPSDLRPDVLNLSIQDPVIPDILTLTQIYTLVSRGHNTYAPSPLFICLLYYTCKGH